MTLPDTVGRLLVVAGGGVIWLAMIGMFVPRLDALASFIPVALTMLITGLLLGRLWQPVGWALPVAATLAPAFYAIGYEATRAIPASRGGDVIRVLTHNVHARNPDMPTTMERIIDIGADIIVLQEVVPGVRDMLAGEGRAYPHATDCPGDRCGLLIAARWPILDSGYMLEDSKGRRMGPPLLWAHIAAPDGSVTVATTHYPWPIPPNPQAEKRRAIARALAHVDREHLILAGDMNLTPWSAAMRAQDADFAPMVRMTRGAFSFPATLPLLAIDHLYAGPGFARVSTRIMGPSGSDHRPILVTLERR